MAYRRPVDNKEMDKLQPPQSLDTEKAILGSILKDPEGISKALEVIDSPEHFYNRRHQKIFSAALAL